MSEEHMSEHPIRQTHYAPFIMMTNDISSSRKSPREFPIMIAKNLHRLIKISAINLSFLLLLSLTVTPAEVLGAGNGQLSWTANTEPDLAGYEIFFGDQDGVYNHPNSPISVGLVTSYDFAPGILTPGVTYFFALKAKDSSNNLSGLSDQEEGELPPDTSPKSLSVTVSGSGNVSSDVGTINCPATSCTDTYSHGTVVTLTAVADAGLAFAGWSGAGCSGIGSCVATMDQAQAVTATFSVTGGGSPVVAWTAAEQNPGGNWTNSGWDNRSFRILLDGTAITTTGSTVQLTLQGRESSSYAVERVSLVQRDGSTLNGVDSTFQHVTFGNSWDNGVTVPAGGTVTSDPIAFDLVAGQDVFLTFWAPSGQPTVYYTAGSATSAWTIQGTDQSPSIDWQGLSITSTRTSIYLVQTLEVLSGGGGAPNPLTISLSGNGNVSSDIGTINCPAASCTDSYSPGTVVTLSAVADAGSDFAGWTGAGCSGIGTCAVTMDQAQAVTATFSLIPPTQETLTLAVTGSGSVSSDIGNINCPAASCTNSYTQGTVVTLSAVAGAGSNFTGWNGGNCSGTAPCAVTMDQAHSVTATFENDPPPDTTPPTIDITNPTQGEVVSGVVSVNSSANDNIGVEGVRLLVNNTPYGVEDTVAPYSINWDTTALLPNSYNLNTIARDAAGLETTSATITVSIPQAPIDNSFPSVSITSPGSGSDVFGTVSIDATASDNIGIVGVRFLRDNILIGSEDLTAPYSVQWNTTTLPLGQYDLTAIARDAAGNETISAVATVNLLGPPTGTLDITNLIVTSGKPYEIKIDSLQNGETVYIDRSYTFTNVPGAISGATYIKTANNDKNKSGNNFLSFTVNQQVMVYVGHDVRLTNKPSWLNSFTDTGMNLVTSDTTLELYSQSFPAGTVVLGGNSGSGKSMYSVVVALDGPPAPDTTPPTVSLIAPIDGQEVSGVVNISATAADNIGITGVRFLVDNVQIGAEDTTTPYSIPWDTNPLTPGSFNITAIAKDTSGNETTSETITVSIIDNSFPSISITSPSTGADVFGTVTISATASDNVGVVGVKFFRDNVLIGSEDVTDPYSVQWDTTTLPLGSYDLTAIAEDAAGNETTSATVQITIIDPPTGPLNITNLSVESGKNYEVKIDSLQNGETVYIDRSYTFTNVPGAISGATYIKTANNDKNSSGTTFLSFTVDQPVTVYVGHDVRLTNKPAWLNSFTDTGMNLVTSDTTLDLYSQSFPAGTVVLGGNNGQGKSMYSVVITSSP